MSLPNLSLHSDILRPAPLDRGFAAEQAGLTLLAVKRGLRRHGRVALFVSLGLSLAVLSLLWARPVEYWAESLLRIEVPSDAPAASALLMVRDHRHGLETVAYQSYFQDRIDAGDRGAFRVTAEEVPNSHLIRIRVRSRDREGAARLANQYAQFYGDYLAFRAREALRGQYETLSRREAEAAQQLKRSQEALRDVVETASAAGALGKAGEWQGLLGRRDALTKEYAEVETIVLEAEKRRRAGLSLLELPGLAAAVEETGDVEEALRGFEGRRARISRELQALRPELERWRSESAGSDEREREMDRLKAQAEADRRTLDAVRDRMAELKLSLELPHQPTVQVEDEAVPPRRAVFRGRLGSMVLSGLVFAASFLFMVPALERGSRLRVTLPLGSFQKQLPREIERIPTLTARGCRQVLQESLTAGPARDAFWRLALEVERAFGGEPHRCLLVSSAKEREGKSFVAAALAGTICAQGKRVLLVDGHLASPSLSLWFPQAETDGGLLEWLQRRGEGTAPACQRLGEGGSGELYVVTSRGWASEPAALLSQTCFSFWLRRAREEFDLVILDGPEVDGGEGGVVLAPLSDGIVLVHDAGIASARDLRTASRALEEAAGVIVGVVENRSQRRSG